MTTLQTKQTIDQLAINTIRMLSIDAIEKANSGHPGITMGAAPMAYTLWEKEMNTFNGARHLPWTNVHERCLALLLALLLMLT